LKKGNLSEKKFGGKKIHFAKKFLNIGNLLVLRNAFRGRGEGLGRGSKKPEYSIT
jgi:hypothetical protein